jgi:hypothetical protein
MKNPSAWGFIFLGWLFISPIIIFAWAYRGRELFEKFDWDLGNRLKRRLATFIGFSAFIGLLYPIYEGYRSFLSSIPSSWIIEDESGERTLVDILAALMAFAVALGIISIIIKRNEKRREQLNEEKEKRREMKRERP